MWSVFFALKLRENFKTSPCLNMQSHWDCCISSRQTKLITLPGLPSFIVQSQSQNYLLFARKIQVLNETFWETNLFACWRFLFDLKKLFLLLFQITSWQRSRSKFAFHFWNQEIAFILNTDYQSFIHCEPNGYKYMRLKRGLKSSCV